jgi:hypothetical protein
MNRIAIASFLGVLALAGCGRDVAPADVKLLNVGSDPDDIGPAPTPYGGIVEYNHVDIAGGALPLGVMGLSGYTEIGPDLIGIAPPYEAVFALSYLFDQKLRGATNLALVIPPPPTAAGSCYTQFSPGGPFDSGFNTVDVGDYVDFRTADGTRTVRLDRSPRDYPPEASRLSVFYQAVEAYSPTARTHLIPAPNGSPDPEAMVEVPYRFANFPFGEQVQLFFPGGFTTFDKPVASIPIPSSAIDPTLLTLPEPLGGIQIQWEGTKYRFDNNESEWFTETGPQNVCFEFTDRTRWGDPAEGPTVPSDCTSLTPYPRPAIFFRTYRGQMYTGPWEADDGRIQFTWEPDQSEDDLTFAVKFLAPVDPTGDNFVYRAVDRNGDGQYRPAQVCEDGEYIFDEARFGDGDGGTSVALQGNPSEVLAQVVCKLENDGEFTLDQSMLEEAMRYAVDRGGDGAIFMMGRSRTVEASIPPVKDPFDQFHDVNPVVVSARTVRIGRFFWDPDVIDSLGGAE